MKLTVGAVVLPGTSKKTKTGLWRATRPVVNTKTCNGCGICAYECSLKAITMQEEGK